MKMIKRTLIILIIATTVFTMVKCDRIEDADNIKQEQGDDTLPKDDKEDTNKKDEQDKEEKEEEKNKNDKQDKQDKEELDKNDEHKEGQEKEEIESPVELG